MTPPWACGLVEVDWASNDGRGNLQMWRGGGGPAGRRRGSNQCGKAKNPIQQARRSLQGRTPGAGQSRSAACDEKSDAQRVETPRTYRYPSTRRDGLRRWDVTRKCRAPVCLGAVAQRQRRASSGIRKRLTSRFKEGVQAMRSRL